VHILKLVQTVKEMNTEEYLELIFKLKNEKEFYRLKKTLLINRDKVDIDIEQIDAFYELTIRKKLAKFLIKQPNYSEIEDFLKGFNKEPRDYSLDSQEMKSLFNLNTNPQKKFILVNNQRINVLNTIKNKKAYFIALKNIDSSSNENSQEEDEILNYNDKEKIRKNNDPEKKIKKKHVKNKDSSIDSKTRKKIEKAIVNNFSNTNKNFQNLNETLDKLENLTNTYTSLSMTASNEDISHLISNESEKTHKKSKSNMIGNNQFKKQKQLEKAKETLIQIFNIDINSTNKKFFIQSFIKTQILNNQEIENNRIILTSEENKIFTIYEYQLFHSLSEGQYFGDFALEKNTFRTATIIAGDEDTHLAVINKSLYYDLIYEEKIKLSAIYKDFLYDSIFKDFVKKVDFEKKYFEHFIYEEYPKNHIIVKENEDMENLYFIYEGSIIMNSKKSYFDLKNDIEKFESLDPEIKCEMKDTYYPIKLLEKTESFQYKLKLFSQDLNIKQNSVRKIISAKEIFGLENYVYNLPSYFTYIVNSNRVALFKINFKLLKKLLNFENCKGQSIINNFAKTKVINLIHRLFEIKKSFIDILKVKNYNNNIIKHLFEQLNDKNNDVYNNLALINKIHKKEEMYNKITEEFKNASYENYDENYHRKILLDIESLNWKAVVNKLNFMKKEDGFSIEKSSRKKKEYLSENKTLEKFDMISNLSLSKPNKTNNNLIENCKEPSPFKNLSRNKHRINLKLKLDEIVNDNPLFKAIPNNKLRKVLTIVENESEMNENLTNRNNTKETPREHLINILDISNNINQDLTEKVIFQDKLKFQKTESNKNIKIFQKKLSQKSIKGTFEEEFLKKVNERKKIKNNNVLPNQLDLKMKINVKNTFGTLLTQSSSNINNLITNVPNEEKSKKLCGLINSVSNNNDSIKIKNRNSFSNDEINNKKYYSYYSGEKERKTFKHFNFKKEIKDEIFITKPNFIIKKKNDFSQIDENVENLINNNEDINVSKFNTFNYNINKVFLDLNDRENTKIVDLNKIKEDLIINENLNMELQKENTDVCIQTDDQKIYYRHFKNKNNVIQRISRLIKENHNKEKFRHIAFNKLKHFHRNYNNLSNINKDTIFSKNNYEIFKIGLVGSTNKLKL